MRTPYGRIALALGATALLAPATASGTWPGRADHVAYDVFTSDQYKTYRARPNGTQGRLILRDATDPSWSPNGRRVLFVRENAVWVASARGRRARRVARAPGDTFVSAPAWAPDGRRLSFTAAKENEVRDPSGELVTVTTYSIYRVGIDGRRLRRLRAGRNAVWSPRGDRIALVQEDRGAGDRQQLKTMAPGGNRVRTLRTTSDYLSDLDFAPNGRRLAYRAGSPAVIHVLNVRTRSDRPLARERVGQPFDVVWVPGGKRLAYWHQADAPVGAPAPRAQLRTIKPNGTGRRIAFRLRAGLFPINLSWQTKPRR